MSTGTNIRTFFDGRWHDGDHLVMRAADHGAWLGTTVFDGARHVFGLTPDLEAHCQRLNDSAETMGINPIHSAADIAALVRDGLAGYQTDAAIYIRPMYWAVNGGHMAILARDDETGFCICLEEIAMPPKDKGISLTTTSFHRPVLATALTNAKAGCLYPNNARMLREAISKGFDNALVADALGNVAETATSNIFMVRAGEVLTPAENGTFLAGITRSRVIALLREAGHTVSERTLSFDDFRAADEVFATGNLAKIMPVLRFDDVSYPIGPMTTQARDLYWNWARASEM